MLVPSTRSLRQGTLKNSVRSGHDAALSILLARELNELHNINCERNVDFLYPVKCAWNISQTR